MSCKVTKWDPMDQVQNVYKEKLVTADEAVKIIDMCINNYRIWLSHLSSVTKECFS